MNLRKRLNDFGNDVKYFLSGVEIEQAATTFGGMPFDIARRKGRQVGMNIPYDLNNPRDFERAKGIERKGLSTGAVIDLALVLAAGFSDNAYLSEGSKLVLGFKGAGQVMNAAYYYFKR